MSSVTDDSDKERFDGGGAVRSASFLWGDFCRGVRVGFEVSSTQVIFRRWTRRDHPPHSLMLSSQHDWLLLQE